MRVEGVEGAGGQAWTDGEESFVRERFSTMSAVDIAQKLGRSVPSVKGMITRLGLWGSKRGKSWTPEQDAVIRERYPAEGPSALASLFGKTACAVKSRAQDLGVRSKTRREWSDAEVVRLRELAPVKALAELARMLGRPMQSVQSKVQELGIQVLPASQSPRAWTPILDGELRDLYGKGFPWAEIGAVLGRTPGACQQRAVKIGLRMHRRVRLASNGCPSGEGETKSAPVRAPCPASKHPPEPKPSAPAPVRACRPERLEPHEDGQGLEALDLASMSRMDLLRYLAGRDLQDAGDGR